MDLRHRRGRIHRDSLPTMTNTPGHGEPLFIKGPVLVGVDHLFYITADLVEHLDSVADQGRLERLRDGATDEGLDLQIHQLAYAAGRLGLGQRDFLPRHFGRAGQFDQQ